MELVKFNEEDGTFIPYDVAIMVIRQDIPLVKAWRLYKGLSVEEIARGSDLKTYEIEQLEAGENKRSFHLEKIAQGLKLNIEQLVDL